MLSIRKLRQRCIADEKEFASEGVEVPCKVGSYIFKDNGSNILAVAHLDSVSDDKHFYTLKMGEYTVVFNRALDDRLGAYIILDLLPSLGITCDVLLTTGEERMQSTAEWFKTDKKYNWMFSFDRAGTDVVCYQYDDDGVEGLLKEAGFDVALGSYSDICELGELGCSGFNFGTGYYDNHGESSHAVMNDTAAMVTKFVAFYQQHKDTHFEHDHDEVRGYLPARWMFAGGWGDDFGPSRVKSDIESDDAFMSRTAGLTNIERDYYHDVYNDLLCRGYPDWDAHAIALDEVAYEYHRPIAEDVPPEEDDDDGTCLICGREDCAGLMNCEVCGGVKHDDRTLLRTGMCQWCEARMLADDIGPNQWRRRL